MKANWLPLSAAIALAISSVSASAVDFHGYMRAGMQASARGGDVFCGGDGTAGHKAGRLGDECDTYAEMVLNQDVYNKAGSKFTVNTRLSYGTYQKNWDNQYNEWQAFTADDADNAGGWANGRAAIREFWAGYTADTGYTIWAGKRFYQRKDVHLWDIYTLNNAGYGAGIEGIDIGMGNLNFAVTKSTDKVTTDNKNQSINVCDDGEKEVTCDNKSQSVHTHGYGNATNRHTYKLDLRWNGIPLGAAGTLDATVIYALPWVSDAQNEVDKAGFRKNSGALVSFDHHITVGSLNNTFTAQLGTNGFSDVGAFGSNGVGGVYTSGDHMIGYRFIDQGTYDVGNFGLGYALFYGYIEMGDHANAADSWSRPNSGWEYALTFRPEYKWTDYTRTTLELGYSQMKSTKRKTFKDSNGKEHVYNNPDIYKVTLAQQFTPGKGFWARPAIRFYVSYQGGDQFEQKIRRARLDGHNYQVSFGSQVEAWW